MPTYTFKVLDGCGDVEDETGVSLRDHDHALRYARDVIYELMRNREVETRSWRLDVYENGDGPIYAIPFASIDPTLDHLVPKLRTMVEAMCERKRWRALAASHIWRAGSATIRDNQPFAADSPLVHSSQRGQLLLAPRSVGGKAMP
jgi:hypothetical protein